MRVQSETFVFQFLQGSVGSTLYQSARARFSKAPESFRARKAIFRSSVFKNGEVCTLETSCTKGTSLHL